MVAIGRRESSFTWRRAAYLLVAAIAALFLLSWMHDPRRNAQVPQQHDETPHQEEQEHEQSHPFVEPPEEDESLPFVEPEKEESYPLAEAEQQTTTTSSAFTSTSTSTHYSTSQTPNPSSKPIRMFNGEIVDGLTAEQCDEVFPELYNAVNAATNYWRQKGHTITKEDVDISFRKPYTTPDGEEKGGGAMRILIHENELRVLESVHMIGHLGYRGRGIGSLQLIERALYSATIGGETLPTIEFSMIVEDSSKADDENSSHTFWTYAQDLWDETHQRVWLMPNFDLWYAYPMGSYADARRRAKQHDKPFTEKIPKLVWRGGGWNNWELRGGLVELTEDKDWADVKVADWGGRDSEYGMTQEALCKYAMTVHTEGVTYSGRLKFLMNCNSLIFVHDLQWATYYTHLLTGEGPKQNYVNVNREWTDLEEKVKYYLAHPEKAETVINNAVEKFQKNYMTQAATSCYIRKLIKGYASVAFTPEVNATSPPGQEVVNMRGRSFQRFMDVPGDFEESEYVDV